MQLCFDLQPPLARASDPLTSFEAADRVKEFAASQERLIVSTLEQYGAMGADGIARHCGLLAHAVGKRLHKLELENRIALTGRVVQSESGRAQREWMVSNG